MATIVGLLSPLPSSAASGTPKVVLDPDHGWSHGVHDGTDYDSFPFNLSIAQGVQAALPSVCAADITLTQATDGGASNRPSRAALMADADVSLTVSQNAFTGAEWGTEFDGGSGSFATSVPANLTFGQDLVEQMHARTGRPFENVNEEETGGRVYPYPEFAALPGTYAHIFTGFIDHSYDWEVLQTGQALLVDALVTAIGHALQAQGFQCLGDFPALPSAARLQQLRNLGYQRFLRYNADPISMSTGNFATSEEIFSLSGVGNQVIDLTLNYNAQSGQESPVGIGWQFAYGSFLQQYNDGSILVNLPDGRSLVYEPDGGGGFTSPAGAFATLTQIDATTFKWTTSTETSLTFVQDAAGRGMLTGTTDRQGNNETLTYNGSGVLFPKLASITDQAGQQVAVGTNDDGRITSFTRPNGGVWQLAYSSAGDLTSVTSPLGTDREFVYDAEHRMTAQVGQDGVTFLTNTYDDQSRVVQQTNAFGDIRTLVFDDSAMTTTYTDTEGAVTIYHWNALGQVTKVVDALGGETDTTYNANLQPTADTNPLDQTTIKAYDSSGQVASTTDPLGNTASSTYNGSGDPTSTTDEGGTGGAARTFDFTLNGDGMPTTITNPDGSTQTRTFNSFGDITSSTDENGDTTGFGYDPRGNTTSVTDPLGRTTNMTYDLANRLTSVTDPLGRTTSYDYDANDNLTLITHPNGSTETRSYDVNDQLETSTDRRGAVTTYTRDLELNLTEVELPNGGVIHNTFDNENRLLSTTDPEGNTTTYTLDDLGRRVATQDARGNTTEIGYDAASRMTSQTDPSGATTTFVPDANGRVLTVTDPALGVLTNEWDEVGRQKSLTDQLGHTTSFTYNFRDQVLTTTDPAGGLTTNTYDPAGRLVSKQDPAGAVTTFEYDDAGQLTKVTDALGGITRFSYDDAGNRLSTTDANGHVTSTTYNSMNEPISRTDGKGNTWTMSRDDGGLLVEEADPLGHSTAHTYDTIGNLTATTDALGRTTDFGYDRNQRRTTETANDGVTTAHQFDKVGNLVSVIRNKRGGQPASSTVNVTTSYAYNSRNLLVSTTDANSAVTGYQYDVRGLLSSSTNPLGKITAYSYDAAGNRASRTDANGVVTNYTYDPRDLLTKQDYPGAAEETFSYDEVGRQLTATNATGTVATTYDALGRPTDVTDAASKTLHYGYDPVGNRTGLTLPDGRTLAYTYDAADQMTKLVSPLGTMDTAYDDAGRPTLVTRPNGTKVTTTFDNAGELTGLITKAGSTVLASFAYSYNSTGNVASRAQKLGTTTTSTYTYDPLRRLTATAGGPLPSTYTYDAVGNRLTWSSADDPYTLKAIDPFTQTSVFNAAGQVTQATVVRKNGSKSYTSVTTDTYDDNGNRLLADTKASSSGQSTATAYAYDFENRLLTSLPADVPQQGNGEGQRNYRRTYDALGRLVTEARGTTTTTWTADGLNPIVASDPLATTLYLRDAGGQLEGELTTELTPAWYVSDALGSILGSTTSKAKPTLVNVTPYSDYGVKLAKSYTRMGFGGEIADPSYPGNGIGNDTPVLSQYYARSFDPGTGSWLQADPMPGDIARPETLSPYQFVGGNPSSRTDLLGFLSVAPCCGGQTISGTSVSTTQYNVSVGNYPQTWNSNSLNGGNLQSGSGATHFVHPTITAQQLQATHNPFVTVSRSPGSKGRLGALAFSSPAGVDTLQPAAGISAVFQPSNYGSIPVIGPARGAGLGGGGGGAGRSGVSESTGGTGVAGPCATGSFDFHLVVGGTIAGQVCWVTGAFEAVTFTLSGGPGLGLDAGLGGSYGASATFNVGSSRELAGPACGVSGSGKVVVGVTGGVDLCGGSVDLGFTAGPQAGASGNLYGGYTWVVQSSDGYTNTIPFWAKSFFNDLEANGPGYSGNAGGW
jgi:RHS repeat-associated protein